MAAIRINIPPEQAVILGNHWVGDADSNRDLAISSDMPQHFGHIRDSRHHCRTLVFPHAEIPLACPPSAKITS